LVGFGLEKASDFSLKKGVFEFWKFLAHLLRGRLHVSAVFAEVGKDPLAEDSVGAILISFGHLIGLELSEDLFADFRGEILHRRANSSLITDPRSGLVNVLGEDIFITEKRVDLCPVCLG